MERRLHLVRNAMVTDVAPKDSTALPAELHATTERLQRRVRRLRGRTNELQASVERLRASTERLRTRLQSSFPPAADGPANDQEAVLEEPRGRRS
jgi:predicted RNase H-like nuclease (RuvC/YqgF family)